MPEFSLQHYIALRELVDFHEGGDLDPQAQATVSKAQDALAALRKFFPSFERWEREQA